MDRNKQIAAGVTFLVTVAAIIWLMVAHISWDQPWPVQPDPYIEIAAAQPEEFIEVEVEKPRPVHGDRASAPALTPENMDNQSQPAPETGVNIKSQGPAGDPAKTVVTNRTSPVQKKQKEQPAKAGNPEQKEKDLEQERQQATARRTQNETKNAFGKATAQNNALNGKEDTGNAGRVNGLEGSAGRPDSKGTSKGSYRGTVGGGWKMPVYSRNIQSNEAGSVTFEVSVNPDGTPGTITRIGGSGLSDATVAKCQAEIRQKKFTHPAPETARATTARITFTFQDPK